MPVIHLVNPNTNRDTTAMMVATALEVARPGTTIEGVTVKRGPALIVDQDGLSIAEAAVLDLADQFRGDGVIVAAFGDPGADALRACLEVPVIGIGEAAMRAAGEGGRRFAVATTTPALESSIRQRVRDLGLLSQLAGIRISSGDPSRLTADTAALEAALTELVERCHADDGADAVIIGGGPLARAARFIAARTKIAIIEPVPAAVFWLERKLGVTDRLA